MDELPEMEFNRTLLRIIETLHVASNQSINSSFWASSFHLSDDQIQQIISLVKTRISNKTYDAVDIPAVKTVIMVAYVIIIIVGLLSNATVIFVIAISKSAITVTSLFVISLSISDLTLCVFSLPIQLHYQLTGSWVFGEVVCRISLPAFAVPMFVSTSSIFIIAFDRHRLVVHPFKKRLTVRLTSLLIVGDLFMSVFFASPVMYYTVYKEVYHPLKGSVKIVCNERWPASELRLAYSVFVFFVLFCIPLIMTAALYFQIYLCLSKKSYNPKKYSRVNDKSSRKNIEETRALGSKHESKRCRKSKSVASPSRSIAAVGQFQNSLTPHFKSSDFRESCPSPQLSNSSCNIPNRNMKRRFNKTNRILIATVINFFICWTPWNVFGLLTEINPYITKAVHFKVFDLMLKWLAMLSVCINPLLYCWLNENLRCEVNAISLKIRSSSRVHSNLISSFTSNQRRHKTTKLIKASEMCQENPGNKTPQPKICVNDPSSLEALPVINASSANEA